jgi:hypothetical protein
MHALFIVLVVLIGGTVIVSAALIPFSTERGRGNLGRRRVSAKQHKS